MGFLSLDQTFIISRALLSGKLQNENENLFWGISRALLRKFTKMK
jgi:hypothetical protein